MPDGTHREPQRLARVDQRVGALPDPGGPTGRRRPRPRRPIREVASARSAGHHRVGVGVHRHRRRQVHAVSAGEVVERVGHRAPLAPQGGDQVADQHRRADAVLVAHRGWIDAVPDGLLVGVDQRGARRPASARASHLKPVSVSTCRAPWLAAIGGQHPRRHDGAGHDAAGHHVPGSSLREHVIAQ